MLSIEICNVCSGCVRGWRSRDLPARAVELVDDDMCVVCSSEGNYDIIASIDTIFR